jgi:branched-subunit amino acid transport protein AzlD
MALLLIPVFGGAIFIASIIWALRRPKRSDSEFPDFISVTLLGVLVGVLAVETVVIRVLPGSVFPTGDDIFVGIHSRLFLSSLLVTIFLAGFTPIAVIIVTSARKRWLRRTLLTLVWAASAYLLWIYAGAWTDFAFRLIA